MKANNLKTKTLVCAVNNNILTLQTFQLQLDANYKWVSHVALVTASGDTDYDIAIRDTNGTFITTVYSRILEAASQVGTMERFYPLNVVNGQQLFYVDITRRSAVAVTGSVHVVFRLESKCPS